jgi:hypothetical protein
MASSREHRGQGEEHKEDKPPTAIDQRRPAKGESPVNAVRGEPNCCGTSKKNRKQVADEENGKSSRNTAGMAPNRVRAPFPESGAALESWVRENRRLGQTRCSQGRGQKD